MSSKTITTIINYSSAYGFGLLLAFAITGALRWGELTELGQTMATVLIWLSLAIIIIMARIEVAKRSIIERLKEKQDD